MASRWNEAPPPRTHNTPDLPALTKAESSAVEHALEAVAVFRKNFEFWVAIGEELKALHDKAEGIGGKKTYDLLREREGLGKDVIGASRSSRLIAIIDNLDAVKAWREDKLDDKQRFEWASPEAVHRHCPVFAKDKPEPTKSPIERALERLIKVTEKATSSEWDHVMVFLRRARTLSAQATAKNESSAEPAPAKSKSKAKAKSKAKSTNGAPLAA